MQSCCKTIPPDPPDPPDTTKAPLTLVWKNNYDSTPGKADSIYHSQNPLIYNGDIIYSIDRTKMDVKVKIVRAEGLTGAAKWVTILPNGVIESMGIWQDKVIIHCDYKTFCLDAADGHIIWIHDLLKNDECWGTGAMKIMDGFIYHTVGNCFFPQQTYLRLIKINITTGKEEEVIRFDRNYSSARSPFISPPNKLITKEGDEILFFMVNWLHISAAKLDSSIYYYAYNMTKKKMLWEKPYFEKATEGNYSPMVWEDKVYFVGWNRVHCFDAFTGEQKWSTHMPEYNDLMGFLLTEPYIHDGVIVMKPLTENLYGIDAETGKMLWTNQNTEYSNVRYLVPYKDMFCFDCEIARKVFMIELSTGKKIFSFRSPHEDEGGLFGMDGVAVDEERGLLYANDGIYFMCFKINVE